MNAWLRERLSAYGLWAAGGAVLCVFLMLPSGCMMRAVNPGPLPSVESPESFSMQTGAPAPEEGTPWWEAFSDPVLDGLIETALQQNFTIAQAVERIDRAQAILRQVNAVRFPQLGLDADVERTREWQRLKEDGVDREDEILDTLDTIQSIESTINDFLDSDSGAGGSTDAAPDADTVNRRLLDATRDAIDRRDARKAENERSSWTDTYETEYSTGLSLSWEADLWGRLRSATYAQREDWAAALHDYEALRLLLSAQVAEAYYQAVEQRLQYDLLQRQRESAQTFLELIELRFLQGNASIVDVLQQRGQLADIDAEVPVVESQLRLLENRLDVLLGEVPDGEDRTGDAVAQLPADTALPRVAVPVELLQSRPDLKALQRVAVAADFRVASAIAERLPRLTLNGSLVYGETSLVSSVTGSGAASLFQPLIDWGERKAAVMEAESRFRESLLAYTEAYLVAVEEVETALWREARQRDLIEALVQRETILQQTVNETRVRYGLGVTDYLPVLTAIQDLQEVQRDLLRDRRVLVSLRIELYRSTGGATVPRPGLQPLEGQFPVPGC
ncbi:MAG: TolC family protein [Candidatus Hydrogenedentes bacterium]|nr:TolC family protein [Candidatus Hydrogenedentota bacterium]